jgi:hypothetical protein
MLRMFQNFAPHMGVFLDQAVYAMGRMPLDVCLATAVLKGERPAPIVNPEVYEQ